MAEDSGQERTEDPTAKRLSKARGEGQVAKSTDVSAAMAMLAGVCLLATVGGSALNGFARQTMAECFGAISVTGLTPDGLAMLVRRFGGGFLLAFIPYALGVGLVVILANLAQTRGVLSLGPVTPKLSNLHPSRGIKKIVGWDGLVNGGKAAIKVVVVAGVAYALISRALPELSMLSQTRPAATAAVLVRHMVFMGLIMGMVYLVVAFADLLYQRHRYVKNMRMTHQEVRYEHKDTDGNPQVKGRLMAMARMHARRRMLQQVPNADVVVINPTHIAVALKYDLTLGGAPMVLAMGQRKLAQRIRDIANKASIPVIQNKPVARALLATAQVGQPIPPALYAAVAEILAFVYKQRGTLPGLGEPTPEVGS